MVVIGAGVGIVGAGYSVYKGIKQSSDAKKMMRDNQRPNESIPQEELSNQQLAQNMSLEGLPSEQYEQAKKNIQRQQAAAIAQSQDRRSGVGTIGAIQQGTNDAYGNLDAASAGMRRQNQLGLINVNSQISGYRDKLFDWNQRQKYIENQNYSMSLLGMGNQNIMGGIDKGIAGIGSAYASGAFGGNNNGQGGDVSPRSNPYDTSVANTGGSAGSPAGQYQTINPYAYSSSALIGG
jgi:hypothetical protein